MRKIEVHRESGLFLCLCFLLLCSGAAAAAGDMSMKETQLAGLINEQRAARKLPLLSVHPALSSSARVHSVDMAQSDVLNHDGSAGDKAGYRIEKSGYAWKAYGEIIGREHGCNPKEMLALWLQSPRHASIMLSGDYAEFGIGAVRQPGVYGSCYWTVVFGSPADQKKGAR